MAIVSTDLLFFQSERMNDSASGGGRITGFVAQDGVSNNVFPDVTPADRAAGALHLRRVFGAVMSENDDALSGSGVSILENPGDSAIDAILVSEEVFAAGVGSTTGADRASVAQFISGRSVNGGTVPGVAWPLSRTGLAYSLSSPFTDAVVTSATWSIKVGDLLVFNPATAWPSTAVAPLPAYMREVTAVSVSGDEYTCTLDSAMTGVNSIGTLTLMMPAAPGRYGMAVTSASASAGDTSIKVGSVWAKVCEPGQGSVLEVLDCRTTKFFNGQTVLVRNGSTVETKLVKQVHLGGDIDFTSPLANSFASGSIVAGLMSLGTIQSRATDVAFAQQTWTKVWSDTLIGNGVSARYNVAGNPFECQNVGSETDRFAFVFTSATEFDCYSERHGQVGSGNTAADFSPVNPRTGAIFFTVPTEGWGGGWMRGNVWRINTVGAHTAFWVGRYVEPSSAGGSDQMTLELRGSA